MKTKASPKTVRRSVALSRDLVQEVSALAPRDLRQNFNRLVAVALQEFAARQRARTFEEAMAEMAADAACKTYNCTQGGILFGGAVQYMPLARFLSNVASAKGGES